jgi:hypothetical protein
MLKNSKEQNNPTIQESATMMLAHRHQDSFSRAILQSNGAVLLVEGGGYSAAVRSLTKPSRDLSKYSYDADDSCTGQNLDDALTLSLDLWMAEQRLSACFQPYKFKTKTSPSCTERRVGFHFPMA